MNLYDNSSIDCNKNLLFINKVILLINNTCHDKVECKARTSPVVLHSKELVFFVHY